MPDLYTVRISERQRKTLRELVRRAPYFTGHGEALAYWPELLDQLPRREMEDPRTVHSLVSSPSTGDLDRY